MAENKKSFLLYCDLIHTVSKMPDDKAGQLLKHVLEYVNDLNPQTEDLIIQLTFEPIKQQLKRDLVKYEEIKIKRSKAGLASVESKQQKQQVLTNVKSVKQTSTKSTVIDNVNVSDSVNVKDIKINNIEERKLKFAQSLSIFINTYSKEMIRDFYDYWSESNPSNTKFRKELEKTWDNELRLKKWSANQKVIKKEPPTPKPRML